MISRYFSSTTYLRRTREIIFAGIIFLFLFLVVLKLFEMQVLNFNEYQRMAIVSSSQVIPLSPRRGTIYDRNGVKIAESVNSIAVFVVQRNLPQDPEQRIVVLSRLASIIDQPLKKIIINLERRKWDLYGPIFLAEITKEQAIKILEFQDELPGVLVDTIYLRKYSYPYETSHLIGYIAPVSEQEYKNLDKEKYHAGSYIGKTGIERIYDEILRGKDGKLYRMIDANNNIIDNVVAEFPVQGKDIRLTVDIDIQKLAYDLIRDYRASVVVLKPATGEIIALVSSPSYDPNRLSMGDSAYFMDLSSNPSFPLYNRVLQGTYQPGSTFKVVTAFSALYYNKWNPRNSEYCTGSLRIGKRIFNDWAFHGLVKDIEEAIKVSCDVYFYKIGLALSPEELFSTAQKFGIGELTLIDLPNENKGFRPSIQFHKQRYKRDVLGGDMANLSIGQGDWLITPLQLANVVSMIFNDGVVYKPYVVKEIFDSSSTNIVSQQVLREITADKSIFQIIKNGMIKVFDEGTAKSLKLYTKYHLAGKTGTAENPHGKPHSLFVAYAPTDYTDPGDVIVVSVVVENVGAGSAFAAPIAAKIIETYFNKYGYRK